MANYIRVALPSDVAADLVAEGIAVKSTRTRGAGALAAMEIAVDLINTGSALVSVAMGATAIAKIANKLIARLRSNPQITLVVKARGRTSTLSVDPDSPDSEAKVAAFLAENMV